MLIWLSSLLYFWYIQAAQTPANSFFVITENSEVTFKNVLQYLESLFLFNISKNEHWDPQNNLEWDGKYIWECWNHELCGMQHTFFSKSKYNREPSIIFLH